MGKTPSASRNVPLSSKRPLQRDKQICENYFTAIAEKSRADGVRAKRPSQSSISGGATVRNGLAAGWNRHPVPQPGMCRLLYRSGYSEP